MIFTTTIKDMNSQEWSFEGEVVGKGMYDDNGEKSGLVVEGFNIVDILLTADEEKITEDVENINVMPDRFSEREIRVLKQDAEREFLEDWMNVQDIAAANAHDLLNEAN